MATQGLPIGHFWCSKRRVRTKTEKPGYLEQANSQNDVAPTHGDEIFSAVAISARETQAMRFAVVTGGH
jgi:hypothetical protein